MVLSASVSVWAARHRPGRWMTVFAWALALLILAAWAGEYVADVVLGIWSTRYDLPLQLTDAVSITSALALLTRRALLVELTYFWAFTATLQAVLTPDLAQSYPSVFYFTYFTYHVGAIVAACFLVFGWRSYPRPRAAWRVFGVTLAFAALAGLGDVLTNGNYMYLRNKPTHASLLTLLGAWPWYIVAAAAIGLLMLLVVAALTDAVRNLVDPIRTAPPHALEDVRGAPTGLSSRRT